MAKNYIKQCLTLLVIREIQKKTTMRYHYKHRIVQYSQLDRRIGKFDLQETFLVVTGI